jgi:4-alpha-glucanotransferase
MLLGFCGNTFLISPERLCAEGWVSPDDVSEIELVSDRVDFGHAYNSKEKILRKAYANYQHAPGAESLHEFEKFCEQNQSWLEDYALFRALKTEHHNAAWHEWEPNLVRRKSSLWTRPVISFRMRSKLTSFFSFFFSPMVRAQDILQRTRAQGGRRRPDFVAHDSADVWTNPEQFKLDENGVPTVVAGVPPDYFSATGQYWGNPLYDWGRMLADGFKWWIERVRATLQMVDIVRIDHFRDLRRAGKFPAVIRLPNADVG